MSKQLNPLLDRNGYVCGFALFCEFGLTVYMAIDQTPPGTNVKK
jgi:hypothetical protein